MNNETNSFNNGQNINTTPVVPNTVPVSNINQINQTVVPTTTPVVAPTVPVAAPEVLTPVPTTQPVQAYTTPVVEPTTVPVTEAPTVPQPVQAYATPVVEPTTVPVTEVPTVPQTDDNAMINEKLKKVEIQNYNPPSKFKVFVLFLFFAGLVAFIIFLPQISSFVRNYGKDTGNYQTPVETITTGSLVCDLTSNTTDLDKEYEFVFSFTESKLKRTKYIVYTRGDSTTENTLDEMAEKCKTLKEETKDLEGVSIKCDYSEGKLTETQIFELETVDTEKLNAAFTEAGGMLPSYKYDQDIDDIEKNMKASGYTCEREN